jgi:hypothetical protein
MAKPPAWSGVKLLLPRTVVKIKKVNGRGFYFFHAAKIVIFCVFTPKSAIQKIR